MQHNIKLTTDSFIIDGIPFCLRSAGMTLDGTERLSIKFQQIKKIIGHPPIKMAKRLQLEISNGSDKSSKTLYFIQCILYNLYIVKIIQDILIDKIIVVKYSRNENNWKPLERYGRLASYPRMVEIIRALEEHDYIGHQLGTYDHNNQKGCLSFFYPTQKTIDLLEEEEIETEEIIKETILLKDANGHLIDYKDTKLIKHYRQLLASFKNLLKSHSILLPVLTDPNQYNLIKLSDIIMTDQDIPQDTNGYFIDISYLMNNIRMIFNLDFDKGGRVYHGIQNLPKDIRKRIKIDCDDTVCWDYKCIHGNILYDMVEPGCERPEDCYNVDLEEFKGNEEEKREMIKKIFQIYLNASTKKGAIAAIREGENNGCITLCCAKIESILIALNNLHHKIKHYFGSGIGINLQNKDKDMCLYIMEEAVKRQIVVLTIHDGFIVKAKDQDWLYDTMVKAYQSVFGKYHVNLKKEF